MNAEMIAALRELEREKGIAFETILQGLEEAMAAAYKTAWKQEHPDADDDFVGFRAEIDAETGEMRTFQQVLDEVDTFDARASRCRCGPRRRSRYRRLPRSDRRADRQAGDLPEAARRRARDDLRGVRRPRGRRGHRHRAAIERRYTPWTSAGGALLPQAEQVPSEPHRNGERLRHTSPSSPRRQGPADRGEPHSPRPAETALRDGGPEIGTGSSRSAPWRASLDTAQDRGVVQRARGRSGRRLWGPKGPVRNVVTELRGEKIDVVRGPTTPVSWWPTRCSLRRSTA
jgi:N utilization substance protein A